MNFPAFAAVAALLALWGAAPVWCQFGQNQVIIDDFQWKVRSTEHFDIHYYDGSAPRAAQAAEILETAFSNLVRDLEIPIEAPPWASRPLRRGMKWQRRPFFLYASPNDFQQSNISAAGDGTGGITEPFKNRFMVYNDGTDRWLEEVATHEFVHIMQFHVLITGFWRTGAILKTVIYPLWMIEGMAGFFTYGIESALEEITIRDAATSGGLIPLVHLEHFGHLKPHQITLAYKQGAAALDFLAEQFGRRKVARMLKLFETRFETGSVLMDLVGLDAFEFDRKYREYVETKYRREARVNRLREPGDYGAALTRVCEGIPQFNAVPVFSPDGRTMYFISTRSGHPPVVMAMDLSSRRVRRLWSLESTAIENLPMGNFANLSRVMSLSRDGSRLVFAATRNHRDGLYFYDLRAGRLERRDMPGFMTVAEPGFSPDGRQVVFSGMRDSVTDIYLYDLASRKVTQLTDDPEDDEMPVFTPDGENVVYAGETRGRLDQRAGAATRPAFGRPAAALSPQRYGRRLYRLGLKDRSVARLEDVGGESRDPVLSADGKRVLFVRADDAGSEICELDLESRRVTRLTRSIGGSFTPAYAPNGEIAFASLRGGSVHVYRGPRAGFENEELASQPRELSPEEKFLLPGMGSVGVSSSTVALSPERPYRFTASTDLFLPAFFYSSPGGLFWTSYWQGSDLLGNHQASVLAALHSGKSYDYSVNYNYLRRRPRLSLGLYGWGRQELIDSDLDLKFTDKVHGQFAAVSYPLDRHHRLEAGVSSISEILRYEDSQYDVGNYARIGSLALVRDAVRGRYLVATGGNRARVDISQAVDAFGGNRRYHLASVEGHQFVPTGGQSALAFRAAAHEALGRDHPDLILGGLGGVRGFARSTTENAGNRLAVVNAEWRFPVLPDLNYYMWYIFPDFYFKALYGSVFADTGYAWNSQARLNSSRWSDVRTSAGLGLRLYTFILQDFPLVISMDYARRTTQNGGIFYVYLGQLF